MVELRDDPEKVEGALQERDLGIETGQADIPHRLQPDLVEGRRQIVGPGARAELAKAVGKGERELALARKAAIASRTSWILARPSSSSPTRARSPLTRGSPARSRSRRGHRARSARRRRAAAAGGPHALLPAALGQVDAQDDVAGERRHRRLQPADQQHPAQGEQYGQKTDDRKKADNETAHAVRRLRSARGGAADGRRARRPPSPRRPARRGCRRTGRAGRGSRSRPRCRRHRRCASGAGSSSSA